MSNKYVVLNCPTLMGNRLCYGKVTRQCAGCTDCVIKQVIEKCKYAISNYSNLKFLRTMAEQILDMFDIEEINK